MPELLIPASTPHFPSANMSEEVKTLTVSVKVPHGDPIKLKVRKVNLSRTESNFSCICCVKNLKIIIKQSPLFHGSWQDTKMDKIFTAIAGQLGVDKNNLRFTFDGKRVQAGHFPFLSPFSRLCNSFSSEYYLNL